MLLKVFVDSEDSDNELQNKYYEAAHNHNNKIINNPYMIDAGFDLYAPGNEGDDNVLPRIREVNALIDELDCVSDSEKWTELTEELADLGSDYFGVRERKVLWEDDMLPGFYVSIYNDLIKDD